MYLELQRRLGNLSPLMNEFNAMQAEIELLSTDLDSEQIERDNFESEYYDFLFNNRTNFRSIYHPNSFKYSE